MTTERSIKPRALSQNSQKASVPLPPLRRKAAPGPKTIYRTIKGESDNDGGIMLCTIVKSTLLGLALGTAVALAAAAILESRSASSVPAAPPTEDQRSTQAILRTFV